MANREEELHGQPEPVREHADSKIASRPEEGEAKRRQLQISAKKARRAEQLDGYIAAFIGTEQEFSRDLELVSIESWINEEHEDER